MNVGTKKVTGMEAMSVLSLLIITAATFQFWFNQPGCCTSVEQVFEMNAFAFIQPTV